MKLIDFLAKLGILRWGAKHDTYHSNQERPAEFMMDGVFNAERDLVNSESGRNPTKKDEPGTN